MFEDCKVYGPYLRKDGRQHVVLVKNGVKKTMSYPKYIYQMHYNLELNPSDTVDHVDRNFNNNSIDNLVVRERKVHSKLDAKRVSLVSLRRAWCGCSFERRPSKVRLGMAGPFCSKKCSGKYGANLQHGLIEEFEKSSGVPESDRIYFYLEK